MSEVRCSCGHFHNERWLYGRTPWIDATGIIYEGHTIYCPKCGDRLSVVDGVPVAEPMVPRAALERAVRQLHDCPLDSCHDGGEAMMDSWCEHCGSSSPFETELHGEPTCKQIRRECTLEDCWVRAALAATEVRDE